MFVFGIRKVCGGGRSGGGKEVVEDLVETRCCGRHDVE
jgi:hypothetical protein